MRTNAEEKRQVSPECIACKAEKRGGTRLDTCDVGERVSADAWEKRVRGSLCVHTNSKLIVALLGRKGALRESHRNF